MRVEAFVHVGSWCMPSIHCGPRPNSFEADKYLYHPRLSSKSGSKANNDVAELASDNAIQEQSNHVFLKVHVVL